MCVCAHGYSCICVVMQAKFDIKPLFDIVRTFCRSSITLQDFFLSDTF